MTTSVSPFGKETQPLCPSVFLLWTCRVVCGIAIGISGYLAWTAFNAGEVAGCGGGEIFDCGHVLTSKYAKVFGIPVSAPAFGLYASLLVVLAFFRPEAPEKVLRFGWAFLTVGGVAAGLAAVWFIGVQVFDLKHLCPYCLGAHACGLLLAGIILWKRPLGGRMTGALTLISAAGVAVLIGLQLTTEPPPTFVVERFDDVEEFNSETSEDKADADVFGAPAAPFEAPVGVVFAAPVTDPPSVTPSASTPTPSVDASKSVESSGASITIEEAADEDSVTDGSLQVPDVTEHGDDRVHANDGDPDDSEVVKPAVAFTATLLFISPSTASLAAKLLAFDEVSAAAEKAETKEESPPAVVETPERLVTVSGNKFSLNARHWPLLGKPDAKYIFVEMFDYTCPHCRNTHKAIDGAFSQYGDDLAVIALPVPLDGSCNDTVQNTSASHKDACELSKIAVAVWRVDQSKFKEFHDWMFEGSRSASAARARAETLVGKEKLAAELKLPHASDYVSRHVELYKRVGRGSVPKLMFPKSTMTGEVSSAKILCNTIERELAK